MLTEAQRRALKAMPLDYMEWGPDIFGALPEGVKSRATLQALERKGYAKCEYGAMSRTWKITPAARAALEAKP